MSPVRPMVPCRALGCGVPVPGGTGGYCEQHKSLKRAGDREYNRNRRDKRADKFYHSDTWKRLRQAKLRRSPLCEVCSQEGRLTLASMVHHDIEIREDMSQALVIENLISCCLSCHNRLHGNNK